MKIKLYKLEKQSPVERYYVEYRGEFVRACGNDCLRRIKNRIRNEKIGALNSDRRKANQLGAFVEFSKLSRELLILKEELT
jgi:hypothetical protein